MYRRRPTRAYRAPRSTTARLAGSFRSRPGPPLPELKFYDIQNSGLTFAYDDTPITLNTVAAGNDSNLRLGRNVTWSSLLLKYMALDGSAQTSPQAARLCIIYDKTPQGAQPAVTDVFVNGPSGHVDTQSNMNLNNKHRFIVLYDKIMTIETASTVPFSHQYNQKYIKLPNLKSEYIDNTTGAIAKQVAGSFLMYTLGDIVSGGNLNPVGFWNVRLRFRDG